MGAERPAHSCNRAPFVCWGTPIVPDGFKNTTEVILRVLAHSLWDGVSRFVRFLASDLLLGFRFETCFRGLEAPHANAPPRGGLGGWRTDLSHKSHVRANVPHGSSSRATDSASSGLFCQKEKELWDNGHQASMQACGYQLLIPLKWILHGVRLCGNSFTCFVESILSFPRQVLIT